MVVFRTQLKVRQRNGHLRQRDEQQETNDEQETKDVIISSTKPN